MNSTSHADNMIPLVVTQVKRKKYFHTRIRLGKGSKELDVRLPCTSCCKKYYLR